MFSLRLALCAVVLVMAAEAAIVKRDKKYTTQYDNINIDEVLKSERLVLNYVNCALEKGKCTPDAMELKKNLPDALTNECANCSEVQKSGAEKTLRYLLKNNSDLFTELEKKYDTTGSYRAKYDGRLKEIAAE